MEANHMHSSENPREAYTLDEMRPKLKPPYPAKPLSHWIAQCICAQNTAWSKTAPQVALDKWEDMRIAIFRNLLPSGNGFDDKWFLEDFAIDETGENPTLSSFTLASSFHVMNNAGYYVGWVDFSVVVSACLLSGCIVDTRLDLDKDYWAADYEWLSDYISGTVDYFLEQRFTHQELMDLTKKGA